jgi:hypothetical protein
MGQMTIRAGHALFSRLRAYAFALLGEALRALFLASNFAFLRSRFRAPALFEFSRSSIFCALFRAPRFRAHLFVLLDFRASKFVLMLLIRPGQDSQDRTARTGHPEQDMQKRTCRTGQPEQDSKNRTGRTRLP